MTFFLRYPRWVDFTATGAELGTFVLPYHSLTNGVAAANTDDGVVCKGGAGATSGELPTLTRPMMIRSWNGMTWIGY